MHPLIFPMLHKGSEIIFYGGAPALHFFYLLLKVKTYDAFLYDEGLLLECLHEHLVLFIESNKGVVFEEGHRVSKDDVVFIVTR